MRSRSRLRERARRELDALADAELDLDALVDHGAMIRGPHRTGGVADGPGLILFDGQRRVDAVTPAARAWLAQVAGQRPEDELPYAVYTVAAETRRRAGPTGDGTAVAHVRAENGGWLMLHGSMAAGPGGERVVVIVDASKPAAIAPLLECAYGLSRRESEVTELVLQGITTAGIAQRLCISRLTVQQHLKVVFAKVGVHSRLELISEVFAGSDPARPAAAAAPGEEAMRPIARVLPQMHRL